MHVRILFVSSIAFPMLVACGSTSDDVLRAGGEKSSSSGSGGSAETTTTAGVGGSGGSVDNGMPSDTYPAFTPKLPSAMDLGGPVLATPKIVPVFFGGDDASFTASLTNFYAGVGATSYWSTINTEYGVGPATSAAPIQLTESAPATLDDTAIQTWLGGKLNADDPAFPAADDNTVYVLNYPSGVTISQDAGGATATSCVDFGGYHSDLTLDAAHGSREVAYAVIPRCGEFDDLTALDAVTAAASHELVEASTDPYPMVDPAYGMLDEAHLYWLRPLGGAEIGDLCAQQRGSFTKFPGFDYTVQRCWSNKSAKALHDPCVPVRTDVPYFNAASVTPDSISTSFGGQTISFKGVHIALGETKDVELDLFSDGPTSGPWTVEAKDVRGLLGQSPALDLALDRTSGQNGEKLHLTVTVLQVGKHNTESFLLVSKLGDQSNIWVGIIGS